MGLKPPVGAGSCSRALLELLAAVRNPDSRRRARGLISFQLTVLHIDEGAALGASPANAAAAVAALAAAGGYSGVAVHVVPLEDVFSSAAEHMAAAEHQQSAESAEHKPVSAAAVVAGLSERSVQRRNQLVALLQVRCCACAAR